MGKSRKTSIFVIAIITFIAIMSSLIITGISHAKKPISVGEMQEILHSEVLNQKENSYYVYYHLENCPDCKLAKDAIDELAGREKLYIVRFTNDNKNEIPRYDWDLHYSQNIIEIGKMQDDKKIFAEGESEEKYKSGSHLSEDGKKLYYDIIVADDEFSKEYPITVPGNIYARLKTPFLDYADSSSPETIIIAGYPTILHILDGKIVDYYFDAPDIIEFVGGKV